MKTKIVLLMVCSLLLILSFPALAKKVTPEISEVFVDTVNNQLVIIGTGLDNADVSLGEYPDYLTPVLTMEDDELVVELPAGILEGDYKLTVSTRAKGRKKMSRADEYDLTIGASCSITECINPGEATLTCGATSVTVPCLPSFAIGDTGPAGGIVFYVADGGLHGLEAAPVDQDSGHWGCLGGAFAIGVAIGTGAQNTADIIAACPAAGNAARIADDYAVGGFDDWFLPSKWELYELYLNRAVVGGLDQRYWSSSNYGWDGMYEDHAWFLSAAFGGMFTTPKHGIFRVRAVRAF